MRNRRFPNYPDDTDYTTNAPSYYDDLARKEKLIRLLAERIWGYEKILDETLEEIQERFRAWDKNLEDFPEDVKTLLQQWLDDGTLDHIINDTIFNWKLDTTIFEQFRDDTTTHLQQADKKLKGVVNVAEFNGTTNGEKAKNALAELNEYQHLRLTGEGVLEISEPLVVTTKNIHILSNGLQRIKAIAPMEACIIIKSKNSASIVMGSKLENIHIDANNLAEYGVLVSDTVGLYISNLEFRNVQVRGAIKDGFSIIGPAWTIQLVNISSAYNGRDGVRAIMAGTNQLNDLSISDSFIHSNSNNGITINGTANKIRNNTIERNKYGVSVDTSLNGELSAWAIKNTISDNYLELNELAQIHVKSKTGSHVAGLSIVENYLLSSEDTTHTGTSLIKVEGAGNFSLSTEGNYYLKRGKVVNDIDGGGVLSVNSSIRDTRDVINGGWCVIDHLTDTPYKIFAFSGGLIQNASYDYIKSRSENLLAVPDQKIAFGLSGNSNDKMLRSVNVFVETDATNYNIRVRSTIKNLFTGVQVKQTYEEFTKTSSGLISSILPNLWGLTRLKRDEFISFEVIVNSSNGTYLYTHVPYIETT